MSMHVLMIIYMIYFMLISRAACRGSLLDFGVFPDIEGAFPDLDNH